MDPMDANPLQVIWRMSRENPARCSSIDVLLSQICESSASLEINAPAGATHGALSVFRYGPIVVRLGLPMDPRSQGVADLSSRRRCSTLAGMARQAPLPKQRHYRNPARKNERCVIASFRVAESIGFKGEFRQWEGLLRIGK